MTLRSDRGRTVAERRRRPAPGEALREHPTTLGDAERQRPTTQREAGRQRATTLRDGVRKRPRTLREAGGDARRRRSAGRAAERPGRTVEVDGQTAARPSRPGMLRVARGLVDRDLAEPDHRSRSHRSRSGRSRSGRSRSHRSRSHRSRFHRSRSSRSRSHRSRFHRSRFHRTRTTGSDAACEPRLRWADRPTGACASRSSRPPWRALRPTGLRDSCQTTCRSALRLPSSSAVP